MSVPDINKIALQIASQLRNIKVTAVCDVCEERWEAVVLEAPTVAGLMLIPKNDKLEFARGFYQEMFDRGHPEHKMKVTAEFTSLVAYAPRQVPYV